MDVRVIIFEDNNSLRESLVRLFNSTEGYCCAGAFPDCSKLLQNVQDTKPDVVLMDIEMPGMNGIEAVKLLQKHYPDIKIMMQTIFEDSEKIFQSICAGASGYILKNTSPDRLIDFIRETFEGGAPMSPSVAKKVLGMVALNNISKPQNFNLSQREKDVLACLVKGMSYKLIGDSCNISIDTVRSHIKNIYEKLHVHSKGEAVAKAIKDNIV